MASPHPPPACLQRHPQPAWLPLVRRGWLADNDEGAASCQRFWEDDTAARLAALRPSTREVLVEMAVRCSVREMVCGLPIMLEASTARLLAAPLWAQLERGGEAAVVAAVAEIHNCEACHLAAASLPKLVAAGARLNFLHWCPCDECPPPRQEDVQCHTADGRYTCSAGCGHEVELDFKNLLWGTARRCVLQQALVLVGATLGQIDVKALEARGDSVVRAMLTDLFTKGLNRPLPSAPGEPGFKFAPCARVLLRSPWPTGPLRLGGGAHATRRRGGRHFGGAAAEDAPAAAREEARECASPGCVAGAGATLRLCGGCNLVRYCSTACQRAHWAAHKPACRAAQPLSFAEFAAEFERFLREARPELRAERDGEFLAVSRPCDDRPGGNHARLALRNFYEKWPGVRGAQLARHVQSQLPGIEALLRSADAAPCVTAEGDPAAPWSILVRSGIYFATTAGLSPEAHFVLPFPELDASARDPFASGPALAMALAQHTAFATHRADGSVAFALPDTAHLGAAARRAVFLAAVHTLGTERTPAALQPGTHDAGGVTCTVKPLMGGTDSGAAPREGVQLDFSDAAAVARLASPAFCVRLAAALQCAPAVLVVVPLLRDRLLVARCDAPASCCALGDFALWEDLSALQRTMHLSSRPLRLQTLRRPDGLAQWTAYENYGGAVPARLTAPCLVPGSAKDVAALLARINRQLVAARR